MSDAPALAMSVPRLGRVYRYPTDGAYCPSVTNVIDGLGKPWLAGWAAKVVAQDAWAKRELLADLTEEEAVDLLKKAAFRRNADSAARGARIHAYIEALQTGRQATADPEDEPWIRGVQAFLDDFKPEFLAVEVTLFSAPDPPQERYGGTADFVAAIGDHVVLGDWKTGAAIYDEVALQLAALRRAPLAWDQTLGKLVPAIEAEATIVVHVQPGGYEVRWVETDEFAFETFRALRQVWPWTKAELSPVREVLSPASLARRLEEVP